MSKITDFNAPRLFVDADLTIDAEINCTSAQANYLRNVLRLGDGDTVLIFNGRDGEWQATLSLRGRRNCSLRPALRTRGQEAGPDIDYLFAPLKRARLDYMVQKAAEMGVRRLRPVMTRYTQVERVNQERMRANAVEAAEQCGIIHLPEVLAPERLTTVLANWPEERPLIFCDEAAGEENPLRALADVPPGPLAVLIGPEGGFSPDERDLLNAMPCVTAISLGPRILRADTAAIAALALLNAVCGDWQ